MKGLKRTQKICKVLKIIYKILFILGIVAAASLILTLIGIIIIPDAEFNKIIADALAKNEIAKNLNITKAVVIIFYLMLLIIIGSSIALTYLTMRLLNKELIIGTPFDDDIVKGMRSLAIKYIIFSVVVSIVVAILADLAIHDLTNNLEGSATDLSIDFNFSGGITFGIGLLLLSCLVEHGADLRKLLMAKNEEEQSNNLDETNVEQTNSSSINESSESNDSFHENE